MYFSKLKECADGPSVEEKDSTVTEVAVTKENPVDEVETLKEIQSTVVLDSEEPTEEQQPILVEDTQPEEHVGECVWLNSKLSIKWFIW